MNFYHKSSGRTTIKRQIDIFTALEGLITRRSSNTYISTYTSGSSLLGLALNNQDDLAYLISSGGRGGPTFSRLVFSKVNQPDVSIASASTGQNLEFAVLGDYYSNPDQGIALNNQGTVTFSASGSLTNGFVSSLAIFTPSDNSRTTLSKTYAPFVDANDNGLVILSIGSNGNTLSLFNIESGELTLLANTTSSEFKKFNIPAINNNGDIAFSATLNSGQTGIFTGTNPNTDKVIATGDSLGGSTVTSIYFSSRGFNNNGQIGFLARLADGTSVIFRADPVSEQSLEH